MGIWYAREGYPVTIFRPTVTYGRQRQIVRQIEFLEKNRLISDSDEIAWEDELIEAQSRSTQYFFLK
ncbi:MAG: hypothetical protein HFJ10_05040 [Lachnospiraceae bacterium]|nr:hypothetical protein [Lachnospiraceae bacterium]